MRVPWPHLAGHSGAGACGFAGVALLMLPGGTDGGASLGFLALAVLAAFSWLLGTYLSKGAHLPRDPFLSTALQMLGGGAVALVAGLARGEAGSASLDAFSAESLVAFAYLIVLGSLVAFTAFVWLLQHAPVSKVSTYAYVNPVIAVFLGWAILSEEITATILVAAAVILSSVAVIVRRESAEAAEAEAAGAGAGPQPVHEEEPGRGLEPQPVAEER